MVRAFRHCAPEFAVLSDATLAASAREGGRFNPQFEFGAVYVALDRATVLRELVRRAKRFGLATANLLPRTLLTLRVQLSRVLDLSDAATASAWGLTPERLRSDELSACQEVARAARRDGYEAIRFPAAAEGGDNMAIFLDRLRPGSSVTIEASEEIALADRR